MYTRNGHVYTGDDPNTALLLVTGQLASYGELDDGFYQAGESKNYEILTTGQYSGACVFILDGKTENQSHNCVRDLRTGKMWARFTSAYSGSVGPGSDGRMPWTFAADDIFQYCAAANAASLGGYSDWRVANAFEMFTLCDMEAPTGLPDGTAFPGWSAAWYWSSTTLPSTTTYALYLRYVRGLVSYTTKDTLYLVSLIRGGI